MPVTLGTQIGPYEITGLLGKGGMGEVYKARDTRLSRNVALKFSGESFSATFRREARAIAALNHPNICTLYDVGPNYLVMELVEGSLRGAPFQLRTCCRSPSPFATLLTRRTAKALCTGISSLAIC